MGAAVREPRATSSSTSCTPTAGVFGSHVANVIRRLKRICALLRLAARSSSAPRRRSRNPRELASGCSKRTTSRWSTETARPRGERRLVFYNPPVVNRELGIRRSSMLEARTDRGRPGFAQGVQTIVFCRSRLQVEVMLSYLREDARAAARCARRVRGYRGGYLPLRAARDRGRAARAARSCGVVSTNALELGIDIGAPAGGGARRLPGHHRLDLAAAGAGRAAVAASVGVFVASSSPLDQFIVRHPEYFLEHRSRGGPDRSRQPARCSQPPAGRRCSSCRSWTTSVWAARTSRSCSKLFEEDGSATRSAGRWFWSRQAFPAEEVSLRRAASTTS